MHVQSALRNRYLNKCKLHVNALIGTNRKFVWLTHFSCWEWSLVAINRSSPSKEPNKVNQYWPSFNHPRVRSFIQPEIKQAVVKELKLVICSSFLPCFQLCRTHPFPSGFPLVPVAIADWVAGFDSLHSKYEEGFPGSFFAGLRNELGVL